MDTFEDNYMVTNEEYDNNEVEDKTIEKNHVRNPFFVPIGKNKKMEIFDSKEIYISRKPIYGLCVNDRFSEEDQNKTKYIYDRTMDQQEFFGLTRFYFTLVSLPRTMLQNRKHYDNACVLTKNEMIQLKQFDHDDERINEIEENEIVIPFFELKEKELSIYSKLYETGFSVDKVKTLFDLIKYYTNDHRNPINKNKSELLLSIEETNYWANKYNCNMNNTNSLQDLCG